MTHRNAELTHGMIAVSANAAITIDGTDIVVAYGHDGPYELTLNGTQRRADDLATLAQRLADPGDALLPLPITAHVAGTDLVIRQPHRMFGERAGAYLTGRAVAALRRKAEAIAPVAPGSWLEDVQIGDVERKLLDTLIAGERWDGPLVVSMPRTGSTLMGILFLLLHDPPGSGVHVIDRYIHEPAAPVYWLGRTVDSIDEVITEPLTPRDVIQESAYQFASRELAAWFVEQARKPIVFMMRHPQLAWPSRWRILLEMRLEHDPADPDSGRIRSALDTGDFSGLGDVLTRVSPVDNGWYAFLSMIRFCLDEGHEFVVVDNGRFRSDPDGIIGQVMDRLGLPFDEASTHWNTLAEARSRVVMGDLARGDEYDHYYRQTIDSADGIVRVDRPLTPAHRFPDALRGEAGGLLTIDEAVTLYHMMLARPETLRS